MWLLARHGTRHPSREAMVPMARLLPKIRDQILANHRAGERQLRQYSAASCGHLSGRGELCAEDVASLGQWRFKLTAEDGSMLTESGARDMLGLGQS